MKTYFLQKKEKTISPKLGVDEDDDFYLDWHFFLKKRSF
jgi:hypothetical protein